MFDQINVDLRRAIVGGGIAAITTLLGSWGMGHLAMAEARVLMETTIPTIQSFASTVTLASGTILALMLTLIGLNPGGDRRIRPAFYERVRQIAFIDANLLVFAVIVYLVLNVPVVESEKVAADWYVTIYYASIGCGSLMGGALITVVMMIYSAFDDVIGAVGSRDVDHHMIRETGEGKE